MCGFFLFQLLIYCVSYLSFYVLKCFTRNILETIERMTHVELSKKYNQLKVLRQGISKKIAVNLFTIDAYLVINWLKLFKKWDRQKAMSQQPSKDKLRVAKYQCTSFWIWEVSKQMLGEALGYSKDDLR